MDFESLSVLLNDGFQAVAKGEQLFHDNSMADAYLEYCSAISSIQTLTDQLRTILVGLLCKRASILVQQNKHYKALTDTNKALEYDLKSSEAHMVKSSALVGMRKIDQAQEELRHVLLHDPNNLEVKEKLASIISECKLPEIPALWRLPENVWERIFTLLDIRSKVKLELVCKHWKALVPGSWKNIKTLPNEGMPSIVMPDYFQGILRKCGFYCTSINFACVEVGRVLLEVTGRYRLRTKLCSLLECVAECCPRLEELIMPNAAIIDEDLEFLFQSFPLLNSLIFRKIVQTPEGILRYLYSAVVKRSGTGFRVCPRLQTLSLTISQLCPCIDDQALTHLANNAGNTLVVFELHKNGGNYVSNEALESFIQACPNVEKLSLQYFGNNLDTQVGSFTAQIGSLTKLTHLCLWLPELPEDGIIAIVNTCKKLTTLELHSGQLSASALATLISLKQLTDLRLDVPQSLPWSQVILDMSRNNPTLEVLALTSVSEADLFLTLRNFASLKQFCLWSVTDITSATMERLLSEGQPRATPITIVASCYELTLSESAREMFRVHSNRILLSCFIDHNVHRCDFDL